MLKMTYGHHNICRKASDKIQCPLLIKSLSHLGMKGHFLILIRAFMKTLQVISDLTVKD